MYHKTLIPMFYDLEEELIDKLGIEMNDLPPRPIISIGGLMGTGKNSFANGLEEYIERVYGIKLNVQTSGNFFRKVAKESGFDNVNEYVKEGRPDIDIEVDSRVFENAITKGGIYVARITTAAIGGWDTQSG